MVAQQRVLLALSCFLNNAGLASGLAPAGNLLPEMLFLFQDPTPAWLSAVVLGFLLSFFSVVVVFLL